MRTRRRGPCRLARSDRFSQLEAARLDDRVAQKRSADAELRLALGLTGVLWQSVTRRTREIGLRRAMGASAQDTTWQKRRATNLA